MGFYRWIGGAREIGKDKRIIYSDEALNVFMRYNNGVAPCLISVYQYATVSNDKPVYDSAWIDRILIQTRSLGNTMSFHEALMKRSIKHVIIYNGEGYDTYVFTKVISAIGKDFDHLLADWRKKIEEKGGLSFQLAVNYSLDAQSVIPNTWVSSTKRYAIPLVYEDLYKGEEHVLDLATHNRPTLRQVELDQLHEVDLEADR